MQGGAEEQWNIAAVADDKAGDSVAVIGPVAREQQGNCGSVRRLRTETEQPTGPDNNGAANQQRDNKPLTAVRACHFQ